MPGGDPLGTDVLIVGGGITGCAAAYFLAREGLDVVLIEREDIATGASGRNAGNLHLQLLPFIVEGADESERRHRLSALPLFPAAIRTWRDLERDLEEDWEIRLVGGLMVAETPQQLRSLERKTLIEREAGIETHILGANEVREMAPYLSPAVTGAEFCPGEGKMNALAALPAIAKAAQAAGARLLRGVQLEAIERRDSGMTARTNRGPIHCARLVNATGPSAAHVAAMVGASLPVGPKVVQSHVSEPVAPMIPHLVYHCQETLTLKQLNAGNLVIAGGWPGRQWGDGTYPWVRRESMEGNMWIACRVVPEVARLHLLRAWAGINVRTDGRPILGPLPGLPAFYNAVPPDAGWTAGPLCARLTAEMLTGRTPSLDVSAVAWTG